MSTRLTRRNSEVPARTDFGQSAARSQPRAAAIRSPIRAPEALRTLVLMVPLFYNPDTRGFRKPVEGGKIGKTEEEIRRRFSGYSKYRIAGWYRDNETGSEYEDQLLRFEIDAVFSESDERFLRLWKRLLARRFQQQAIYMKLSGPVIWT